MSFRSDLDVACEVGLVFEGLAPCPWEAQEHLLAGRWAAQVRAWAAHREAERAVRDRLDPRRVQARRKASNARRRGPAPLTAGQKREIAWRQKRGATVAEIARAVGVAPAVVRAHLNRRQ